ncbi:hypothetical protein [Pleurocapsa sp. FMAR1]|uniref:hypothetical protein n=1 Tax=Pleurocapsa sp. FMAR1 TaxID=3040204 RepID=UPI0029C6BFD2|nr:hypothetical protein [Pleurocapsa sp. FMAR1]
MSINPIRINGEKSFIVEKLPKISLIPNKNSQILCQLDFINSHQWLLLGIISTICLVFIIVSCTWIA